MHETVHTREGFRVGFYELYTGDVEEVHRASEVEDPLYFQRLVRPRYMVTCATCYARPEVRAERDLLFFTERTKE